MNEYRITYTTSDQETGTSSIVERNEAAARKSFKGSYLGKKAPLPTSSSSEPACRPPSSRSVTPSPQFV